MIQPINESEKSRIRNLHKKHFILNEQMEFEPKGMDFWLEELSEFAIHLENGYYDEYDDDALNEYDIEEIQRILHHAREDKSLSDDELIIIGEYAQDLITDISRTSLLNEQPGMGDGPWDLSREVGTPKYLNLTNGTRSNLNFDKGGEETTRIDIENKNGFVKTNQLRELSRFPNLEVLHIGGGFVQSVPVEAITPNLTFLSLPGTAIGSLPVEEIANSNIKVLNLRMTRDSISPEDIKFMQENGIDVIT